jgi:phosphoglycerate dehydrogenase-like enzyme
MPTVLIMPEAMREVPATYVDILRGAGFDVRYPRNAILARGASSEEELVSELKVAHAVIAGGGESYSATALAQLPDLRVIARCGVGYDRVDVPAATARRIPVTITPNSTHEAVAELTLALLFAVTKSIAHHDREVRAGRWPRVLLTPLRGRTFGIFGLGRIGSSVARRAMSLGMKMIATETFPNLEFARAHHIELVGFDELLARSDFLSVHCPLNDATRGMFNRDVFTRMKRGAIFINTSRGKVVVEEHLVEALRSGHLRGAALDVFEQEPPEPNNPLFQLPQVVCSPHLAGTDEVSLEAMGAEAATCIVRLFRGEWPEGAVVNKELRDGWRKV